MTDATGSFAGDPGDRGPAHPPFQLERVFGTAIRTFLANLVPLLTVSAVLESPLIVWNAYGKLTLASGAPPSALGFAAVGSLLLGIVTSNVAVGTLLFGVFKFLRHQPVAWGECVARGFRNFPAIFGISIVVSLATVLGFLCCIVPGFYVIAVYAVAIPSTVVEGKGVFAAMARSKALTEGRRWPVFGALFLAGFVVTIPTVVVTLMLAANPALQLTLTSLLQIVSVAIQAVLTCVLYYQLRESRENLDATELAAVFD